jgi:DeoR/GlpR family transcriptional regulator of sugar metabolism
MLARQRQSTILAHLDRDGAVRVSDLTRLLGVSDMTIRRDLDVLARQDLLVKVHGGATVNNHRAEEPGFKVKSTRELAEKEVIGKRAAALVEPGSSIAMTAGTTTYAMATHLALVADLTILTNSPAVAEVLEVPQRPDRTVILTGGVRTPSDALVGPVAVATVRSLHVDTVFMGVHGMTERAGFTTPNMMEAETNRELARSASRLVVVADHTKWGTVGLARIVELSAAQGLVTDSGMDDESLEILSRSISSVIVADLDDRLRLSAQPISVDD